MIYKINQIKISINTDDEMLVLKNKILKKLNIDQKDLESFKITKKSIDARKKSEIFYVYSVEVDAKNVKKIKDKDVIAVKEIEKYKFTPSGTEKAFFRPVIVGFGPAGMFCGYMLAKYGYKPLIIERGSAVEKRILDIEEFWETGKLNPNSNVQFGEGGAGTFSDGKLNTTVNDKQLRNTYVLETLVKFGAPENILYDSKPHVGTDILCEVVKNFRNYIVENGGDIKFDTKLTDISFENNKICEIEINHNKKIKCETLVLAIGHSARDTFIMLENKKVAMEPKPFAIGIRVEHKQNLINESMYGENYNSKLPASPYKLTGKASDGRGVYSFCMCPGGYVVNASSEEGMLAINGMSYSKRDGENANSAIVTTVKPDDYPGTGVLKGMYFQRELEKKAFETCNGKVPVQKYVDFKNNVVSNTFATVVPNIKGQWQAANIKKILPEYVNRAIEECMPYFGKKIKGYDSDDTVFSALESRTSSPVRILRNDLYESVTHDGIYPCGEGAGYAGGITSAAIDGIKIFEAIAQKYNNDF